MVQRDTLFGLLTLGGLIVGMALVGTGSTSTAVLYAAAACFVIAILAVIGLIFFGGEE